MTADLTGKVALVTGATSGIGKDTARQLVARGAEVILSGRDQTRAAAVRDEIGGRSADRIHLLIADLSSMARVSRMAQEAAGRFGRLDVLVNNAGIDTGQQRTTADGFEMTFAVNYLAPFLLTTLLLDLLRRSAPSRVLTIASGGHRGGTIDFDDLQSQRHFGGQRAYNTSKLALVLFTYELARRLRDEHVSANCVDPGFVRGTNIGQDIAAGYRLVGALMWPFMTSPSKAAEDVVWAATDPALTDVSGVYLKRRKHIQSSADSRDPQLAARLWDATEQLLATTR
ncbi:MAG: SDR family oxidoreductase [Streptosporangiaceae bacterium]|nr:SDR family oxidoreductase [Streptosporangiaceae bacterium]